jgi:septum formation protein
MQPLLLASASPRRRELLERVGIALEVRAADIDETPLVGEPPRDYVARIAREKVHAVARRPGQWALAADTTVTIDGEILGKASDEAEARAMLRKLEGRCHQVVTAWQIHGDERSSAGWCETDVDMIAMSERMIDDYVASGEWRGKAGAYAIQGIGAALVSAVRGSVTNVIGLPLVEVLAQLEALGAPSRALARGMPA